MSPGGYRNAGRYCRVLVLLLFLAAIVLPVAATPLASNRHIFINVANNAGVKYDLDGPKYGGPSNTYYIKADGGGLNELHITNDVSSAYGQVSETSDQSGVFYLTNTGGRGFDNDIILLVAVREPVADDFSVTIKSSGYTWTLAESGPYTPNPPTDYTRVTNGVSETFTKADFIYGPQNWKPGPGTLGDMSLPVYNGQDMADTTDQFLLMFVDLKAGNMYPLKFPNATLADNGAVKVEYSFTNLDTFAAFNGYGWCIAANQDQGISWTNPTRGFTAEGPRQSGQSGFTVAGIPRVHANFTTDVANGIAPLSVTFTDTSTGSPDSWSWDFGDSSTSDEQNPVHTYAAAGTYTVTLEATSVWDSDTVTKTDLITVTAPAVEAGIASSGSDRSDTVSDYSVNFTADILQGDPPLTVHFSDNTTFPSVAAWSWDFDGDDVIDSTEQNPVFRYNSSGNFSVKLTITTSGGLLYDHVIPGFILVNNITSAAAGKTAAVTPAHTLAAPPAASGYLSSSGQSLSSPAAAEQSGTTVAYSGTGWKVAGILLDATVFVIIIGAGLFIMRRHG